MYIYTYIYIYTFVLLSLCTYAEHPLRTCLRCRPSRATNWEDTFGTPPTPDVASVTAVVPNLGQRRIIPHTADHVMSPNPAEQKEVFDTGHLLRSHHSDPTAIRLLQKMMPIRSPSFFLVSNDEICGCFEGIMLNSCLLQPCFHVAGTLPIITFMCYIYIMCIYIYIYIRICVYLPL